MSVLNTTIGASDPARAPAGLRKTNAQLRSAAVAAKAGRHAEATELYEALLQREPGHPAAVAALSNLALRERDVATLERLLPALVDSAPQTAFRAAKLIDAKGRLPAIAPQLGRLAKAAPDSEAVQDYVARAASRLVRLGRQAKTAGETGQAIRHLRLGLAVDPAVARGETMLAGLLSPRVRAANAARKAGDIDAAAAAFGSILSDDPGNLGVRRTLALMLHRARRYDAALPHLQRYCELAPDDTDMLRRLIMASEASGSATQMIAPLEHLAAMGKDDPKIVSFCADRATRLGRTLLKQEDHGGAALAALIALKLVPESAAASTVLKSARLRLFGALRQAIRSKQTELAAQLGAVAVAVDPQNLVLCAMVARSMLAGKDYAGAEPLLEQLRANGERSYEVEAGLATVRLARRDFGGAMSAALSALTLNPGDKAMERVVVRLKTVLSRSA